MLIIPVLLGYIAYLSYKRNELFASGFVAGISSAMLIRMIFEII